MADKLIEQLKNSLSIDDITSSDVSSDSTDDGVSNNTRIGEKLRKFVHRSISLGEDYCHECFWVFIQSLHMSSPKNHLFNLDFFGGVEQLYIQLHQEFKRCQEIHNVSYCHWHFVDTYSKFLTFLEARKIGIGNWFNDELFLISSQLNICWRRCSEGKDVPDKHFHIIFDWPRYNSPAIYQKKRYVNRGYRCRGKQKDGGKPTSNQPTTN